MEIRAIVTGATGMVGEGVLHECLLHPDVGSVLSVSRRPCGTHHAKLKEIIHRDFFDYAGIEDQLKGYDACYFCLGVSSVGMKDSLSFRTFSMPARYSSTVSSTTASSNSSLDLK